MHSTSQKVNQQMAGAPAKEVIIGQSRKMTPGIFIKEVVFDPGIVYSVADVLLFAKTNPVGFIACLGATGAAVTLKTMGITQPKMLTRFPRLTKIALDSRTPLRSSGMALLVVGGVAVGTGAILPAVTGFLLAVGNFRLAQSISDAMDAKKAAQEAKDAGIEEPVAEKKAPEQISKLAHLRNVATLAVKRPDLYINAGFACAGLMAGGAGLFVLPILAVSFGVSLRNVLKEYAEHRGHPKAQTAAAGYAFAMIGSAEGHGLIALAHAINASVLLDAERRVTPGGAPAIWEDVKFTIRKMLKLEGKADVPDAGPIPVPFTEHDLGEDVLPKLAKTAKINTEFSQTAAKTATPANDNPDAAKKPAAVEVPLANANDNPVAKPATPKAKAIKPPGGGAP